MAGYYLHVLSPTQRGGLTAKELAYARMPCSFGLGDYAAGKFSYDNRLEGIH